MKEAHGWRKRKLRKVDEFNEWLLTWVHQNDASMFTFS